MREAIADLVHRYADAVVYRNADQWIDTWAPDAVWEFGNGRRIAGQEAILDFWTTAMSEFSAVSQNVLNGTADLADTSGVGRWYIIEHWERTDGTKGMLLAHYDDTYVNVDGQWRFASRELVVQYYGPVDLSNNFLSTGA